MLTLPDGYGKEFINVHFCALFLQHSRKILTLKSGLENLWAVMFK